MAEVELWLRESRSSLSPLPRTTRSETRARPSGQTKSALEGGACERQQKLGEASELVEALSSSPKQTPGECLPVGVAER
jgi:hypothetical protein